MSVFGSAGWDAPFEWRPSIPVLFLPLGCLVHLEFVPQTGRRRSIEGEKNGDKKTQSSGSHVGCNCSRVNPKSTVEKKVPSDVLGKRSLNGVYSNGRLSSCAAATCMSRMRMNRCRCRGEAAKNNRCVSVTSLNFEICKHHFFALSPRCFSASYGSYAISGHVRTACRIKSIYLAGYLTLYYRAQPCKWNGVIYHVRSLANIYISAPVRTKRQSREFKPRVINSK